MLVLWEFHWTKERQTGLEHGMCAEELFYKYAKETLAH